MPAADDRFFVSADALFDAVREELNENHRAAFVVSGNSMWPLLASGRDTVILSSVDPEKVRKGDIVLLKEEDGHYLLHRVTKVKDGQIETTGDGCCYRDGFHARNTILARVDEVKRKGRRIRCTSFFWRMAFSLWMALYPLRPLIFRAWERLHRK